MEAFVSGGRAPSTPRWHLPEMGVRVPILRRTLACAYGYPIVKNLILISVVSLVLLAYCQGLFLSAWMALRTCREVNPRGDGWRNIPITLIWPCAGHLSVIA
jgi:hypothetical protein